MLYYSNVFLNTQFIIFLYRDRTPFVLTSDMVYVINGGDKPSTKFQHFVDTCVQAFNIVRKHGNLLLNLFGLVKYIILIFILILMTNKIE